MRRIAIMLAASLLGASPTIAQIPIRRISSGDIRLYARLLAMTDSRTFDRSLLDSALLSASPPVRAAAALAVGQVGPAHGKPGLAMLKALLSDRDLHVASNSAYALGLLHDSASVAALAAALAGPAPVAREAAWALGEIGAPASDAIVRSLATAGVDEARTIQLLLAAAKLKPVPVAALRPYLAMSARPSVQWAAAYAIARFRAPAGVRDLIALAGNPDFARSSATDARAGSASLRDAAPEAPTADPYVSPSSARQRTRAEIGRALARQAAGDSLAEPAIAVLTQLARDPHPHVRINAVRSLGTYGARGRAVLIAAAQDTDANVRIATAQSLGTALDSAATSWTQLWQRDTALAYRASLLASAARAGARLPAMSDWVTHNDWHYRTALLNAAGSSPDSVLAARAARAMLKDTDGRVRANAYALLAGNDTTAPSAAVHDALIEGLADADFYARSTVLGGLSQHARAADVPAVLVSYGKSLGDAGNDARIAAIGYLAAAWKADSAAFTPAMRQQIALLRPSGDPLVRAAVDSASIFSAWPSTSGNPRPAAWYEEIVRTYVVPALRGQLQQATIRTPRGDIVLELFGADAPVTVWNFMNLSRTGYYGGTGFHRVVPNFVAQDGDPRDDGNGGPGYAIRDEMNPHRYERGALGMALSGPDTGGSQYFITHSPQPHLDGHYTVFGRVVRGYAALDAIVQGDRILSILVQ